MLKRSIITLSTVFALASAAPAFAQQVARVTLLDTPAGSVFVIRDGETFELRQGDQLFDGDTVFTRTNGAVQFAAAGCQRSIAGESQILISPAVCDAPVTTLASSSVVGGVQIGTGVNSTGATAGILGLAGLGGAAAAAGGGGNDRPASP